MHKCRAKTIVLWSIAGEEVSVRAAWHSFYLKSVFGPVCWKVFCFAVNSFSVAANLNSKHT